MNSSITSTTSTAWWVHTPQWLATRLPYDGDAQARCGRARGRGAAGGDGDGCGHPAGDLRAPLLLSQEAFHRGELPHVPGAGGEGAQADAGLRDAGRGGHEGLDAVRAGEAGAEQRDGVPADQSPAGLPDLRSGRRMPAAGHRSGLRQGTVALRRRKARGAAQERRSAGLHGGDEPLHPLHALRALRPGDRRGHGAGHDGPRRAFGDRHLRRPLGRLGALTSKPFRYSARTWELSRRKSVSPHDGLGANLVVQVKHNRVMRVLPLENEQVNECWISDKDRVSYEGLNSEERLTKPMLREGSGWREVEWQEALEHVAKRLGAIRSRHGAEQIGALASPHATLEEMALLAKLARGLGSENVDFRLRQADFSIDAKRAGAPWLGMKIAELGALDRVLVAGSFLRTEHPLIANRLRQAAKRGQQVSLIHVADDEGLIALAT